MRTHLLIAAAVALGATVTAANALTVVNSDKVSHAIMITPQGGKAHKLVIKANKSGKYNCDKGCDLQLGTEKAHSDDKTKTITIKDGKFVQA
jgi:hypothetical protein